MTDKTYTLTLTERQIRDLETYALSQEMKYPSRPEVTKFYNDLFLTLVHARKEKQS